MTKKDPVVCRDLLIDEKGEPERRSEEVADNERLYMLKVFQVDSLTALW